MWRKYRDYLSKIKDSFCDNPKLFWSYHKSIFHHGARQSAEITYKGVTATAVSGKAELFHAYFSSVFTSPRSNTNKDAVNTSFQSKIELKLSDITIASDEVANCLSSLDESKANGPDGICSAIKGMFPTHSTKPLRCLQPLSAIWLSSFRMVISKRHLRNKNIWQKIIDLSHFFR